MRKLLIIAAVICLQPAPLGAQCPTPNPNVPVGTSRLNPAPIGIEVPVAFTDFDGDWKARVTVQGLLRGQAALDAMDRPPSAPPDGMEYLLARVRFALDCAPTTDTAYQVFYLRFLAFSSTFAEYPTYRDEPPVPQLYLDVYPGGSGEGWAAFLVDVDDECPLMAFGRNDDGSGGAWLKMQGGRAQHVAIRGSLSLGSLGLACVLALLLRRRRVHRRA